MKSRPTLLLAWLLSALALGCSASAPDEVAAPQTVEPATETVETASAPSAQTPSAPPEAAPAPTETPPAAQARATQTTVPPAPAPAPERPAASAPAEPAQTSQTSHTSIAVTTLSKGRGVPEPTRASYQRVRALLEDKQRAAQLSELAVKRMGLEGETRLCAEFRDPAQARAALAEIRKLTDGVELINVEPAPCSKSKEDTP